MEMINYKDILTNNIIGVYGIGVQDFLSQIQTVKDDEVKISYIDSQDFEFCTSTFISEVKLNINEKNINKKTSKDMIREYCKELSVSEEILSRKIVNMSSSERYVLYIILNLLFDSQVYIFNGVYRYLDKINKKKVLAMFKKLKGLGKTIIVIDDINVLYNVTNKIFIFKYNIVIFNGNTKEVLTDVEKLIKKGIGVPELPLITYLAKKKKGVKLFYHDDVRDIIKDVYKHV